MAVDCTSGSSPKTSDAAAAADAEAAALARSSMRNSFGVSFFS